MSDRIKISLADAKAYFGKMKLSAKQWEILRQGHEDKINAMADLPRLEWLTEKELLAGWKKAQKAVHTKNTAAHSYTYGEYIKEVRKRGLMGKCYDFSKAVLKGGN